MRNTADRIGMNEATNRRTQAFILSILLILSCSLLYNIYHFANSMAGFSKALNSIALPQGSRKNMVACSPG